MKAQLLPAIMALTFVSCNAPGSSSKNTAAERVIGSWKLVSNKMITAGDTVIAFPEKGKDEIMIKLFNETHFSFFRHDQKQGKITAPVYDSGAGSYTLSGTAYTEHLEYCNYREWENHDFSFQLTIHNDTLVQSGIEKIDSLKVNREIIETYVRIR